MNPKLTDKEFKEFSKELGLLMSKYNIRVKRGSEEIVFGLEGSIKSNGNGYHYVEREVCVAFTEVLTREQAKDEKECGILIV